MSNLGRHRGKHHSSLMSLTPITFDANTFSCCGGSYFATIAVFLPISFQRPLNLVGPSMPTSRSLFIFRDHYLWFRVCSDPELSFSFVITAPEGAAVVYINIFRHLSSELHHNEHGACPPRLYTFVYCYTPCRRLGSTGSFLLQRIALHGLTLALPYTIITSQRNIEWISAIHFAPNLIHQGAFVITEISSAQGGKNSTSSKQNWSHSWHKNNATALQKRGPNYTKRPKY
jgi:hypothetical protein